MKILMINGSPRKNSNTLLALTEMDNIFKAYGFDTEIIDIGKLDISGCKACGFCKNNGKCVKDDIVNEVAKKFEESDALIIGSPVYYAQANGTLVSFLERLFYSSKFDKSMKVGASIVCARRSGCSATFDELNKFFSISSMPIASSSYWNNIHGRLPGEAKEDKEGMQTVRNLAKNISFLVKSIDLGKKEFGIEKDKKDEVTCFIR